MRKTEYQLEIINRLRNKRNDMNLSQKKIGDILGLSDGQVGNIESLNFAHKYTLKQIYELCKVFNYPIEQLFLTTEDLAEGKEIINQLIERIIEYGE